MAEPDGARAVDADGGAWHLSDAVVELGCFLPEVFSCQALAAASRMRRDRRRLSFGRGDGEVDLAGGLNGEGGAVLADGLNGEGDGEIEG